MNLSSGERPVCLPVRTTSGPSAATRPSPWRMASSYSSAVERFARTERPSSGARGRWLVVAIGGGLLVRRRSRSDRPAARDAGPKARRSRLPQSSWADATTLRDGCGGRTSSRRNLRVPPHGRLWRSVTRITSTAVETALGDGLPIAAGCSRASCVRTSDLVHDPASVSDARDLDVPCCAGATAWCRTRGATSDRRFRAAHRARAGSSGAHGVRADAQGRRRSSPDGRTCRSRRSPSESVAGPAAADGIAVGPLGAMAACVGRIRTLSAAVAPSLVAVVPRRPGRGSSCPAPHRGQRASCEPRCRDRARHVGGRDPCPTTA